jgi:type I restriction enzyme M protein
VVAVPPWNQKLPILDDLVGDPRWVWGEPGPNDSNAAWIQHCLYHLADGGRAVIVMANRALFERGRAGRIRQRIIKAGLLDAVLALPPGLFQTTSLACSVLVFVKGRPRANGKPAPTLMVDLRNSSEGRASRSASLGDNVIAEAARLYHSWAAGEEPASRIAAVTRYNDLADNDFVIDPGRYVAVPPAASDLDEVVDERSALVDKLERLSQVSRVADDHLKAILEAHR